MLDRTLWKSWTRQQSTWQLNSKYRTINHQGAGGEGEDDFTDKEAFQRQQKRKVREAMKTKTNEVK